MAQQQQQQPMSAQDLQGWWAMWAAQQQQAAAAAAPPVSMAMHADGWTASLAPPADYQQAYYNAGAVPANYAVPAPGAHASPAAPTPTVAAEEKVSARDDPGVLSNFIDVFGKFLRMLEMGFPECPKVRAKIDDFQKLVLPSRMLQEKFIGGYHKRMSPYYDAIAANNIAPILTAEPPIDLLIELDFSTKYEEVKDDAEAVADILEYVKEMDRFAMLFANLPQPIVGKIEGVARDLAQKLNAGQTSFRDLDLFKIGEMVVKDASAADISVLMQNMGQIYKAVGGYEGMREAMDAGVKIPPMPNLTGFMQMTQRAEVARQARQVTADAIAAGTDPAAAMGLDPTTLAVGPGPEGEIAPPTPAAPHASAKAPPAAPAGKKPPAAKAAPRTSSVPGNFGVWQPSNE